MGKICEGLWEFDANVTSCLGSTTFYPKLYSTQGLASDIFYLIFIPDATCNGRICAGSKRMDLMRNRNGTITTEYQKWICGSVGSELVTNRFILANCRCSDDSCRVDCATALDGFCCIDHSLTDRLLQVLQN